jgi:uncharacterized hydrophobic protein (TIGR00341 family)
MPLRILELTAPQSTLEKVPELLEKQPIVDVWRSDSPGDTDIIWILIDAEDVEALSDVLADSLGSEEKYRLVVLPVEATLPIVRPPGEGDGTQERETEASDPALQRISREELYQDLVNESRLTVVYMVMVVLSTLVAAIGLTRKDVAIVIGAMVIAPLLAPNVALSLASMLGDRDLAKRSLKTLGAGLLASAVLSVALGVLLDVEPEVVQVIARTEPEIEDILLALAAGAAGSLAFTSGVPSTVVGALVAVAFLPPLVGAGLLAGIGRLEEALGGLIVVLANITCINLAAIATFFLQKLEPRDGEQAEQAKRARGIAIGVWLAMLLLTIALILLRQ